MPVKKTISEIRIDFKKLVVEKIHELPHEEAIKNEVCLMEYPASHTHHPITIGRVMAAINKKRGKFMIVKQWGKDAGIYRMACDYIRWNLLDTTGKELTDNDQTDETIEALYKILK